MTEEAFLLATPSVKTDVLKLAEQLNVQAVRLPLFIMANPIFRSLFLINHSS